MAPAIPLIMLGVSVAGAGLSAVGQYRQGQLQKAGYDYNAKVAREKAAYEEAQSREKLRSLLGTQRALYAKAGVDISSGSPLLVMADTAAKGEEEAQMIKAGGRQESALQRMYGRSAARAGLWGGTSSFMSGLAQAGTQYYGSKEWPKSKTKYKEASMNPWGYY